MVWGKDNHKYPDVEVHHTNGCEMPNCGRTDVHYHGQDEWQNNVTKVGEATFGKLPKNPHK